MGLVTLEALLPTKLCCTCLLDQSFETDVWGPEEFVFQRVARFEQGILLD